MIIYLNNRLTQTATALVVLTVIILGNFLTTAKAEAATSVSVAAETFPLLVSGAELALSAVIERSKPGALVSATVASDQKIAELMAVLNQLMTLYQSLVSQKEADSSANSSDESDDEEVSIRPAYYIQVLTPNGGETYVNGGYGNTTHLSPEIDIKYKASGIVGEKLVVYLYNREDGDILTFARTAADSDSIKINIAKGDTEVSPGDYKIRLCVPERQMPDSDKTLCDASDNYFKVVGDPGTDEGLTIQVLTPNGGETYIRGDQKQMPVSWKADCGFEYFTKYITRDSLNDGIKATYVMPDSVAGICAPGQLAIPNFTTWAIPANVKPGSYRLVVIGVKKGNPPSSSAPGNFADASDSIFKIIDRSASPTTPTLKVLTPNGGESYIAGESLITIKYKSSNISGQVITAYLYHPEDGNVRTLKGYATDSGELQMYLAKGDTIDKVGDYKITLCAHDAEPSDGKDLCDSSDSYFKLITKVNPDIDPPIEFPLPPVETQSSESSKTQSRY